MQIIEFNHKTVSALLKKSVEEYWMKDKDAWLKFTDGSVVCIHKIKPTWRAYIELDGRESDIADTGFADTQSTALYYTLGGEERLFMERNISLKFNSVYYYYSDMFDYVTREYIPLVELYYYEKEEEWQ